MGRGCHTRITSETVCFAQIALAGTAAGAGTKRCSNTQIMLSATPALGQRLRDCSSDPRTRCVQPHFGRPPAPSPLPPPMWSWQRLVLWLWICRGLPPRQLHANSDIAAN